MTQEQWKHYTGEHKYTIPFDIYMIRDWTPSPLIAPHEYEDIENVINFDHPKDRPFPPSSIEPSPWILEVSSKQAFALNTVVVRTQTGERVGRTSITIYEEGGVDDNAYYPSTSIRIWGNDVFKLKNILNEVFPNKEPWIEGATYRTSNFGEVIQHMTND